MKYTVELGWTVAPVLDKGNLPNAPHLFTYVNKDNYKSNGEPGGDCYNCEFVPIGEPKVVPGMALTPKNTLVTFGVEYHEGNWWIDYANQWIGYLKGSFWPEGFSYAPVHQVFGEIYDSTEKPKTQMGSGKFGTETGSTEINGSIKYPESQPARNRPRRCQSTGQPDRTEMVLDRQSQRGTNHMALWRAGRVARDARLKSVADGSVPTTLGHLPRYRSPQVRLRASRRFGNNVERRNQKYGGIDRGARGDRRYYSPCRSDGCSGLDPGSPALRRIGSCSPVRGAAITHSGDGLERDPGQRCNRPRWRGESLRSCRLDGSSLPTPRRHAAATP